MSIYEEIGSCRVYMKGDDKCFVLHPAHYPMIRAAWMNGNAFYEGEDGYGDALTVKLGEVAAVALWTPEAIAQAMAEQREDALTGDIE